jgi:hypothetical protein
VRGEQENPKKKGSGHSLSLGLVIRDGSGELTLGTVSYLNIYRSSSTITECPPATSFA